MTSDAKTVDEYISGLPDDRKPAVQALRKAIKANIPKGFQEEMNYGMIGYVIPHKLYPGGYHCDPKLPVPFMNIASQKNFIAVYHMMVYADPILHDWFVSSYIALNLPKLDIGKSCIRFKKLDQIPFDIIGKLAAKVTAQQWIDTYSDMDPRNKN